MKRPLRELRVWAAIALLLPAFAHSQEPAAPKAAAREVTTEDKAAGHDHKTGLPTCVAKPLKVAVTLRVNELTRLSEKDSAFDADIDLELRWNDPCLSFDVKEVGVDRQEFAYEAATQKLANLWNPQITIANLGEKPRIEPGLFLYSDGTVVFIQRIRATFDSKYRLLSFPFDPEALTIRLVSKHWSFDDVQFVQEQTDLDRSGVREDLELSGWKVKGLRFTASRFRGWNGEYFPEFTAQIETQRQPSSHIFVIFVPFLLILLVPTILTLYATADTGPRLGAWSGSLLALVAFNFTLGVRYPALDSSSLVSQVIAIGFCYQLVMIALTCTVFDKNVAPKFGYFGEELSAFLRWCVPLALTVVILTRIGMTALETAV